MESFTRISKEKLSFIQIWQKKTGTLHEDLHIFMTTFITTVYARIAMANVYSNQ